LWPIEFLGAVEAGDLELATRLSLDLAQSVEALPIVKLAKQVREGGPFAIARAVTLATMLLKSADRANEENEQPCRNR